MSVNHTGLSIIVMVAMLALVDVGLIRLIIPAIVVLGPLMVLCYAYFRLCLGPERTMRQYLHQEPVSSRSTSALKPSAARR